MNAMIFLQVTPLINDCPNCSNDLIGGSEGTLEVNDDLIKRTCKCGFNFKYDVRDGVSKKKIKQAIDNVLKSM